MDAGVEEEEEVAVRAPLLLPPLQYRRGHRKPAGLVQQATKTRQASPPLDLCSQLHLYNLFFFLLFRYLIYIVEVYRNCNVAVWERKGHVTVYGTEPS